MRFVGIGVAALLLFAAAVAVPAHPGASIAIGRDGRVYFVDTGRGVFEIDRNGRLTRLDGPALHWFALDEPSRMAKTLWPAFPNAEIRSIGDRPTLVLSSDFPVATGPDGDLYFPEPAPRGPSRAPRPASKCSPSASG